MKKAEAVWAALDPHLSHCELCPRRCRVDRRSGEVGYCRAGSETLVYRSAPHFGEEPPLSGSGGSGTLFFSRCTLRCIYCQNYPWSQEGQGVVETVDQLAARMYGLYAGGCHNWNLVSPTPWLPMIVQALALLEADGVRLPVVYNTSGFERTETLRQLEGMVDVYLADLRYSRDASAGEGSDGAGYVDVSRSALREMWNQVGPLETDSAAIAKCGLICRLLVLPGRAHEAIENLDWLADTFGTGTVTVSVMSQYTPAYQVAAGNAARLWRRGVTREEYDRVCMAAEERGFAGGWFQEYDEKVAPELIGYRMPADGVVNALTGEAV
jgi:putative pyruvate formate lyase activating enzyme